MLSVGFGYEGVGQKIDDAAMEYFRQTYENVRAHIGNTIFIVVYRHL